MTPEEKAKELVDKFRSADMSVGQWDLELGKACALIAVDEIIRVLDKNVDAGTYNFYQEVKEAINQL